MLNQIILVGRLVKTPELFLTENGKKGSIVTLAIGRGFKNQDGEYDTDFIDVNLWSVVAENTAEYCKTGDVVGVRGRIQSRIIENEDGTKYKKMEVVADKVTFLSSAKGSKEEDITTDDGSSDKKEKNKKKK